MHRQMRIMSQIEKRRRYRSWVQAFQIAILLFFADQIVKTYCAGQLATGEQRSLVGQNVLKLARIPDSGTLGLISKMAPPHWKHFPRYFGLGLWIALFCLLLVRLRHAKFGELVAFAMVLSGGCSNLVSRAFTTQTFDTFVLQLGATHFVAFNIADFCVIVGSFFLIRSVLLRFRHKRLTLSRGHF